MGRESFENLEIWRKAKALAVRVLLRTNEGAFARDYGLRDQIRRSAVSIPSNIAEGDERDADLDSIRFFRIAKGSVAELRTQLQIAQEIDLLAKEELVTFEEEAKSIGRMLGALIKARSVNKKS